MTPQRRRGGQPGNKNALRSGRHTGDPLLRVMWDSFDDAQKAYLAPLIKAHAAELPGFEDLATDGQVVHLHRPHAQRQPSITETHRDRRIETNPPAPDVPDHRAAMLDKRAADVIAQLVSWGHYRPVEFVHDHLGGLRKMENLIADILHGNEVSPDRQLAHPAGYFSKRIHEILRVRIGRMMQCPYCGSTQAIMVRPPADDEFADFERQAK